MTKRKSKGAYMISAVAEMYEIHPQTLRLYEREGLLKPSRTEGNTRLYTDEDLLRLEFILSLARDLGVNISGIAIIHSDPASIDTSTIWPRPVFCRSTSANRMPITACIDPPARSAICTPGIVGAPSRTPVTSSTPARDR